MAKTLVGKFFIHYGFPQRLHSDQGQDFESKLVCRLCELLNIKKSRTTPYHPQGDPQPERFNRTLCGGLPPNRDLRRPSLFPLRPYLNYYYVWDSLPLSGGVSLNQLLFKFWVGSNPLLHTQTPHLETRISQRQFKHKWVPSLRLVFVIIHS